MSAKKKPAKAPAKKKPVNIRKYSSAVLDGPDRAPSRAMLYPVGFKKEDFKKPVIGIASTWSQVTPCNFHIDELAKHAAEGFRWRRCLA